MKILKTLTLSFLLTAAVVNTGIASNPLNSALYAETPVKTVFFKHPMATDVNKFFSSATIYNFEIYKAGSKTELTKIMDELKNDPAVESVNPGIITGDFQAITLVLKSAKNKEWFISEFKKAGLNNIKINNNPIVEVDKL